MATFKSVDPTGETRSRFNEQVKDLVSRLQQEVSRSIPASPIPQTRASREVAREPSTQAQVGRAVLPSGTPAFAARPVAVAPSRVGPVVSRSGAQPSLATRASYNELAEATMVGSLGNGKTKVWDTDWITLFGAPGVTPLGEYFTPQADYLDAGGYTNLTIRLSMPGITNVGLKLEHSSLVGGPFSDVFDGDSVMLSGTTTMMLLLSSEGGDRVFSRYLRWGLYAQDVTPPAQWRACFRIEAFV